MLTELDTPLQQFTGIIRFCCWGRGGAENAVTLCDLGILVDQAAEPVPPQDPAIRVHSGRTLTPGGRALAERPVRAMNVVMIARGARGARTGVLMIRTPAAANTASNTAVNLASRFLIKNLRPPA
jgi:hypothetical protein